MPHSVPNYLNTDAQGRAIAIFAGGVVLPTPALSTDDRGASVTWTNGAGGARIAQVSTFSTPGGNGDVEFTAKQNDLTSQSQINLTAEGAAGSAQLRLIGSGGGSSYSAQINGNEILRYPRIVADGTTFVTAGNPNAVVFSVPYTGVYRITAGMSCYANAVGVAIARHFIDNVAILDQTFFFNQTGVHAWIGEVSWIQTLSAGAHGYGWLSPGGVSMGYDSNDRHHVTILG